MSSQPLSQPISPASAPSVHHTAPDPAAATRWQRPQHPCTPLCTHSACPRHGPPPLSATGFLLGGAALRAILGPLPRTGTVPCCCDPTRPTHFLCLRWVTSRPLHMLKRPSLLVYIPAESHPPAPQPGLVTLQGAATAPSPLHHHTCYTAGLCGFTAPPPLQGPGVGLCVLQPSPGPGTARPLRGWQLEQMKEWMAPLHKLRCARHCPRH